MGLQFILGSAGGGKTWYVEHQVVAEAENHPEKQYFVVVPEQFTMQTQKNLVTLSKQKGLWNIEVQSFLRLAFRIFAETGAGNTPVMDDLGKTMILKKVLMNEEKNLVYFRKNIHKKGYIAEIKSFISELMQYDVGQEQLEEMLEVGKAYPILYQKLQDIQVAYSAFQEYIENHYVTSEEVLSVFADIVQESKLLRDSVIYLDGFTGFTPVQYQLLRSLMRVCGQIYVTVTMDKREPLWHVGEKYKLLYMSRKTIVHLRKLAEEEHCDMGPEIWTGQKLKETRFKDAPALAALEHNLFRYPAQKAEGEVREISLHCLRQPETEVHFLVEEILSLREQEGFRYRDIAVITGDMEIYGVLVKGAMEKAGLPCFVDQKKSIQVNPFVDMLCSVLDVLRKDFDYESIMRYLKSGFVSDKREIQLLENFLLASGIRGHKKWQEEWDVEYIFRKKSEETAKEAGADINRVREETWNRLSVLYGQIAKGKHTVRQFADALCDFLEQENFYAEIQGRAKRFEAEGNREQAKEYEQIYGIVISVLERLVELLGEESMSLSEFQEILDTGFSEARIGLIPPGVDQVMVGDLSRTRLHNIKYLFFLGMNDGNIPASKGSGGILSDGEREFFRSEEFELAPTAREKIYTEQLYLYLCLTKPSKHLYLTYCETANDGKAMQPAYIIDRICRIFPGLTVSNDENRSVRSLLGDDLGRKYLVQGLRRGWKENSAWQEVYRQYRMMEKENESGFLDRLVDAAHYISPAGNITKNAARALYQEILTGSTSQFERFAACPYAYFVQYGLGLEERQEHQVEFFDIGNIVHEALERYTKTLLETGESWTDVSEERQHILANECLNATVEEYKNGLLYDTERDASLIDRLRRILQRTVWAITEQMKLGKFETVESELSFRMKEEKQQLIGRVDRIDTMEDNENIYVKVIDYKTGKKDISLSELYYGLQMQLMIYLKATVDKHKRKSKKMVIPAGVLYYHIEDPLLSAYAEGEERRKLLLEALQMNGLVNETDPILPSLDNTLEGGEGTLAASVKSLVVPVATTTKGMLRKNAGTLTTEEFQELTAYTEDKIEDIGRRIRAGETVAKPFQRMDSTGTRACDICAYHGICGFDARLAGYEYRKIYKKTNDEVFAAIRNEKKKGN
ncbi:MAG: exodeoxyribonuclease V subunit gamma [Lachnospiraceae bacterium]|nr:exodeoxyribonuclease V subunit gamma [Lachnospiraceae bacterium]